jgi:hypothetical protein
MSNSHIIFLRHGDTNRNQTLNYDKYNKKARKISKKIFNIINENSIVQPIIFYTSPEKRCIDTLNLLKKNLIKRGITNEIKIKVNKNLIRWNKKGSEPRQDSKDRALKYGKKLKNFFNSQYNSIIVYCTHSSILPSIIEGINNENPGYLNEGAMFYYNVENKNFNITNY